MMNNYRGVIIEESLAIFFIDRRSKPSHFPKGRGKEQYDEAKQYGLSLGIPGYQLDFSPDIKEWDR